MGEDKETEEWYKNKADYDYKNKNSRTFQPKLPTKSARSPPWTLLEGFPFNSSCLNFSLLLSGSYATKGAVWLSKGSDGFF